MIAAGFKYKALSFNPKAAGVGSLLFYVALIGAFTPTMFDTAFRGYREECDHCSFDWTTNTSICEKCYYLPIDHGQDNGVHEEHVQILMYIMMILLPLTYLIGLLFTFKTHSDIFKEEHVEEEQQAEWTILTSVITLCISVMMFGLIAEDLIENIEGFIHQFHISQAFLGATLMCLTPAVTEIASAVRFALSGQISLSIQIGSSSAIQVALVQMPMVSLIAILFGGEEDTFKLIFPVLSIFAIILAVFTLVFVSREGHTNYFIGSVLVMMYILLISSFYFVPSELGEPNVTYSSHK